MPVVYVARSPSLQEWAADVGLTEHVYKVGVADSPEAAAKALNEESVAGANDWSVVTSAEANLDEAAVLAKIGAKETAVDPLFYPRLKGARGLFKTKIKNVQTRMLVQKMMAGEDEKMTKKPKVPDIAGYLLGTALD